MSLAAFKPRDWPEAGTALKALDALVQAGFATRFAGGAVRDALLGRMPQDFDLASVAVPDQVMAVLGPLGFRFVLTGIEHGTVMAVADRRKVEITTLRRDVETDGRRARVAFTTNWDEDAARRDLTMNALYADTDGVVFDSVGGLADLAQGIVRFVGDPAARVAEDALRILRFFRFQAAYGRRACDPAGLAACEAARATLARLSGERVWAELQRLLIAPGAALVLGIMHAHRICEALLPLAVPESVRFAVLAEMEARLASADPVRRLVLLLNCPPGKAGDVASFAADRLKLSRMVAGRVEALLAPSVQILMPDGLKKLLHRHGPDLCRDWLLLQTVRTGKDTVDEVLWALLSDWKLRIFPLTGDDLLAAGVAPGPEFGQLLAALEDWWLDADRAPDHETCLTELKRRCGS